MRPPARACCHLPRESLSQDYFGFRKLLLVSTQSGKLFGLEGTSGYIVWARFLRVPSTAADESERVPPLSHHEAVATRGARLRGG
jgi:hypothetical protein